MTLHELTEELRDRLAVVRRGGSEEAREKHTARGKLLVRDRVDRLLDPGSPFLELSPLAAYDMYGGGVPSAHSSRNDNRLSRHPARVRRAWPSTNVPVANSGSSSPCGRA